MRSLTQIKSTLLLVYFVLSIGFLGSFFAIALGTPAYLLGRVFPRLTPLGDRILRRGVQTLFAAQPWYNGRVSIPENPGSVLMVSNHRSHLDAFILLSRVPGLRILAKDSLFRIPGLGMMMRLMNQIPVRNGRVESYMNAMETVRARLRQGEVVHVFPELTRCPPGFKGTQKFSLLPFQIAVQEKSKIVPIVFRGTDAAWGKGTAGLKWRAPVEALALEGVDAGRFLTAQDLKAEIQTRIDEALS